MRAKRSNQYFAIMPGVIRRAAGRDRNPLQRLEVERQLHRQRDTHSRHVEIVRKRMADHLGLLVDFLRHEMAVIAFVDQERGRIRLEHRALDELPCGVVDLGAAAGDDGPVAIFQVADRVGKRCKRNGVRADEHFAIAVTDRKRRAPACADQQIFLAGKQEGERKSAAQSRQGGLDRVDRNGAARISSLTR